MTNLEDILAEEIERQGARATPEGFKQMLTDTIGRMDNGFIRLERGSISLPDYVRSVRQQNPEFFQGSEADEKPDNLTESMRLEIAESRSRSLPSDWTTVRSRYTGKNNLTGAMMDQLAAERQSR
jgi:hypothetical protein